MTPLSPKRRSELRAEAHGLRPTVLIGDKGLTDEVVAEIDRSLKAHELIKVRAAAASRENRVAWLETICDRLQAHPVQQIGRVFVVYRENPEEKLGPGPSPRRGARGDEPKPGAGGDEPKSGDASKQRRESTATMKARVVSERARERQRVKDLKKRLEREAKEAKGKRKLAPGPKSGPRLRGDDGSADAGATRTSRPRSRTPSPRPESGPRRRRPRTSR